MRTLIMAAMALSLGVTGGAIAKPGNGHGGGHGWGHGNAGWHDDRGCPPGLAKKNNGCLPPGQARKARWARGYRLPTGYSAWSRYNAIPVQYRDLVPYNSGYRYVYQDNYVYAVDPKTRLVQSVIDLLRR